MLSISPYKLPCTIAAAGTSVAVLSGDGTKSAVKPITRRLRMLLGVGTPTASRS